MTFYNNTKLQYRVTLDTETNLFVVYDAHNKQATGITIEKAINELKKSA
jgi:hypothetical protein